MMVGWIGEEIEVVKEIKYIGMVAGCCPRKCTVFVCICMHAAYIVFCV
jgi:hypothetical protein